MKKISHISLSIATAAVLAASAAALPAAAQTYTYSNGYTNYGNSTNGSCTTLTVYQSYGSSDARTGGQVSALQRFLNATGYLSGVSGYFDSGTYGAVVNYQRAHGISQTGTVGPITRTSINQQSCNGTSGNYTNWNANNGQYAPYISSLSTISATPGTSVTLYGNNLMNGTVNVYIGGSTVSSYVNNNGITFMVPNLSNGTYQIYVSNANGSSNQVTFTIVNSNGNSSGGTSSGCYYTSNGTYTCSCSYPYNYNGYSNYNYNNCNTNGTSYNYNNYNTNPTTWFGTGSQPRISNVIGPSTAWLGNGTTYSVYAYDQYGSSMNVSVDWGDNTSTQSTQQSYNASNQQQYSFTHSYPYRGYFTIRFTATDASGAYSYSSLPVSVQ